MLHAEWTLQSDPQRLQALSDQLLNLKTVTPGQFTSMADLDGRLPAVRGPDAPPSEPLTAPIADGSQPEEPAPIPLPSPKPAPTVAVSTPPPRPPEHKPPPRPVIAEAQPVRATPIAARPVSLAEQPRAAVPAPASTPAPADGRLRARHGAECLASAATADAGQRVAMGHQCGRRLGHERRSAPEFAHHAARPPSASAHPARTRCRAWRRCGSPSRTCRSAAHWKRRATASSTRRSVSVCCSSR